MPSWIWIVIAAIVVIGVVAAILARSSMGRKRTERLKEHYGPEYERVAGETGDERAAERELVAREKEHKKLDIIPLSAEAGKAYGDKWRRVQTAFVDFPGETVGEADRLVVEVMNERGYPVDDFERSAADISVAHPHVVEHYRAAHGIYLAQGEREISTEEQRQAFVHYRALFEELLKTDQHHDKSQEATA